jgi:hypothetical protein
MLLYPEPRREFPVAPPHLEILSKPTNLNSALQLPPFPPFRCVVKYRKVAKCWRDY